MSTVLFLTFVCCIGAHIIKQPKLFQTAKLGDDVIIECYLPNKDYNHMVWYKQEIGNQLKATSKSYIYMNNVEFVGEFNNGRFNVTISPGIYHLHISSTKKQDVATYFCGTISLGQLTFGPGTFLMLEEEHGTSTVHQEPISEVHIGDNITFTCRVQREDKKKCEAGHHALWFRETAEDLESAPGIIYTAGDIKKHEERCEEDSDSQSCIYTLTKRSLSLSDAGVYYCAVHGCDKIMFGNGTRLEFSSIRDGDLTNPLFLLLISSNIISMIIIIFLVALQLSFSRSAVQETFQDTQVEHADALTYTSVSFSSKPSRGAKQNSISQNNDVYSQIRS
ncbi:novel immune-type receptor 8 precursor [Danio rerio]|uniref:Novel immune-type receptor 8 n=1 Tax=Danio rerio TaxID=7955 RepID=Q5YCY8_DANRE|nr:novel immune-type receptor 8 precursor [Danio rerio]AAU03487.1 novel immune-type receptor 8 [Danio rerio]|eukprot:NP_001005577.1 novel immune-type receptor 8 precursor [Danio rerio]